MVRLSKQERRRQVSFKRPTSPAVKTGPQKETLPGGFKSHANALEGDMAKTAFIPKIK
jgi:hypothetical protein